MASFLGLTVQCTLNDMHVVTGVVSSIDPSRGTITLSDCHPSSSSSSVSPNEVTLRRDQVASLEVVSAAPAQRQQPAKSQNKSQSSSRRPEQQSHHTASRTAATDDMSQDFDFSAGLNRFDKAREFEAIRQLDTVDPSLRLHAHNKRTATPNAATTGSSSSEGMTKMKPNEMVLSEDERQEDDNKVDVLTLLHRARDSNKKAAVPTTAAPVLRRRDDSATSALPAVTQEQLEDVLSFADLETGPDRLTRREIGSLNLAHYFSRLSPSPSTQMQLLLSTRTRTSTDRSIVALRLASHLLNWSASSSSITALVEQGAQAQSVGAMSRRQSSSYHSKRDPHPSSPPSPSHDRTNGSGNDDSERRRTTTEGDRTAFREALRLFTDSKGTVVRRLAPSPSGIDNGNGGRVVVVVCADRYLLDRLDDVAHETSLYVFDNNEDEDGVRGGGGDGVLTYLHLGALVQRSGTRSGSARQSRRQEEDVVVDIGLPKSLWSRLGVEPFSIAQGAVRVQK